MGPTQKVINRAIANRDPGVAYRIGTRHYAWDTETSAYSSGAPIENLRDHGTIDLDKILRRGETTAQWKFPKFAKDVLEKRIKLAEIKYTGNPMAKLFGKSLDSRDRARKYAKKAKCPIKADPNWADEWKHYLDDLWNAGEPLDAFFGDAWLRQQAQIKTGVPRDGSQAQGLPWRENKWWVKERNEFCLVRIAGERQQALFWSGEKQILELSGENILAFMVICKEIWATWQRRNPDEAASEKTLPTFDLNDQGLGITDASRIWFAKIQTGMESDKRARLVTVLGTWFRKRIMEDKAASNPGHNGFSLQTSDMSLDLPLVSIIKACRDRGDLMESLHTTKSKDRIPRTKWYLHPLLCPLFRIPYVRTKEPIYTTLTELQKLYSNDGKTSAAADIEPMIRQLGFPGM